MKYDLKRIFLPVLITLAGSGLSSSVAIEVPSEVSFIQQKKGRTITGTVIDATDGSPIIGANVMVKGTKSGVITDLDGHYSIQVDGSKSVLVVTYIGYKKQEVPVEDLGIINIQLHSANELLDEVVIVGSGTQKKISVNGYI